MINDEFKIKTTIPNLVYGVLKRDISLFNIPLNRLANAAFLALYDRNTEGWGLPGGEGQSLQFKLNKEGKNLFTLLQENRTGIFSNKAGYFRNIIMTYSNMASYKRERIIFADRVSQIEKAVKKKVKMAFNYRNELRVIEPYILITDKEQEFNYLFGYCETHHEYRNYRLSKINPARILKEKQSRHDEEQVKAVKKNFDPFLSYGESVTVRFTAEGLYLFDHVIFLNKPRVLKREGQVLTLESSFKKAVIYLAPFLDEACVLSPPALRDFFKQKAENLLALYRGEQTDD